MRDQTLRTIGATVVLFGIAIAAVLQIGPSGDSSAVAFEAEPSTSVTETTPTTVQPPTTATAPTTTLPEPFVYRVGVLSGISTDNFWAFFGDEPSVWNSYILGPTKAALYRLDPATGELLPELAAGDVKPTFDRDGWRVRVPLRTDAKWSDGTPVTANDFVFTFETVRKLALGGSWSDVFPAAIESVHADSDYQLRIEFGERPTLGVWPNGPGTAPVMSARFWSDKVGVENAEALYAQSGAGDPAGGPLVLETSGDGPIISVANAGYTLRQVPDVVEYHVYEDDTAAVGALQAGDIDYFMSPKGLTAAQTAELGELENVSLVTNPANGIRYLGFNLTREPMSNPAFRKALALLIDRVALAGDIPTGASVANSFVSSSNIKWYSSDGAAANAQLYDGDLTVRLELAIAGLKASGYSWEVEPVVEGDAVKAGTGLLINGIAPAPLTILTPGDAYDPSRPQHAERIASTLALLGFDVRPVETDFDTVVDLAFTPDAAGRLHYDMYLLGWTLGSPVWPGYYRPLFASDGAMNNTGYSSGAFQTALADYEGAFDTAQASSALWAMEAALANELPYLLLYTSEISEVYRSDRITYGVEGSLGGIQARLGGIADVRLQD